MIKGCAFSGLILVIVGVEKVIISAMPILTPKTVDVMENKSVVLTCTSSATESLSSWQSTENPHIWSRIGLLDNGTCITLGFIKDNDTMYMGNCSGNGVFTVTILKTDVRQHNKTWRCRSGLPDDSNNVTIYVKVPPDGPPVIIGAQSGSKYKIVEHEVAHLSCTVSGGNPLANVIWFCLNGNISEIRESNRVTSNITWTALRNQQNTQCVCVAEHMFGNRNTSVSVDILYKASVLQFYIGASTDRNSFSVSEDENVIFSCIIEGNTPPNVTLSHNGRIIHVSVSDNSLVYTKKHIQCYDSGLYICTAMNEYNNGKSSGRNITVYVNCSPRPFPFFELKEKVNSSIYTSATLRFSALAFPEPGFTWYYLNGSQQVMLTDSQNVEIISFSSQSVLTIRNVTQSDYGQYFLLITNSFGVYEQNYSIEPQITSVSTTVPKIVPNTSSTEAFVAVGVGTFVAALILFGSALFVYRCFRRRRERLHNVHKNHLQYTEKPSSATEDNNEVAEYEQIAMKSAETRTSVSDKRESVTSDEPTKQYERLDESRKETGPYSQLPALYEQMQTSRENTESGSIDIKETHHAMKDYINVRI